MSQVVRLGDVCRIQNGFPFDSACFTAGEGMPLIRIRDINKGVCSVHFNGAYDEEFIVRRQDVLVGMDGEFNIAEWSGEPALLNQRVCRLIANEELLDSSFLLFRIKPILKHIEEETPSTTVKHLSSKQIANIKLQLPNISEQRRIAARLKAQLAEVTTAQQTVQTQLADAALLRQRLLQHAFDALVDAPRKSLGELATTTSGGTPPRGNKAFYGGDIPWLKSGELPDGEIHSAEETITPLGLENSSAKLLPAGTLLIAMYGATVGKLGILTFQATTNQAVCAITPGEELERDYIFYWLLGIKNQLIETSFGGAQPNISQTVIRNLEIPVIPINAQRRIVAQLKAQLAEADALRAALEQQQRDLHALPQRILAQAFEN